MSLQDLKSANVYNLEDYFRTQKEKNETVQALDHLDIITPKYREDVKIPISKRHTITEVIQYCIKIDRSIIDATFIFLKRVTVLIIEVYFVFLFVQMVLQKIL